MLKTCPECQLMVSDKAYSCPHCGYPLKDFAKNPTREKSRKRLRLPNGFGRITKIKGRTRKPYRAMVTVGKDDNGRPIGKLLKPVSYFETYNDAYAALVEYNRDPYDLSNTMTVEEVYDRWLAQLDKPPEKYMKAAWKYLSIVKDMEFRLVRIKHIKLTLDEGYIIVNGKRRSPSDSTKFRIKVLWNQLFDYAIELDITDKNYARLYKKGNAKLETKNEHIVYTDDEMKILWENIDNPIAKILLFQCYTGFRPQELFAIKSSDVHLDEGYIEGGMKTEAGKNRIVPIHPLIKDLVKDFLSDDAETLISNPDKNWTYHAYAYRFKLFLKDYGLNTNHRPHDGRKHFVTLAKKYNVDEFAIKRIVGHKITDITESVYTDRDVSWLIEEMSKIQKY